MKRVGILTVHRSLNYGAVLQAFALLEILNQNGYDAQIIDYISDAVWKREQKEDTSLKDVLKHILRFYKYAECEKKKRKFQEFEKQYYILSDKTYNRNDIRNAEACYDFFVTGSDQIWNFDITDSDTTFMLDFVADADKKKSYAASFGYCELPDAYRDKTKELLSQYSSLLVRETSGVQILKQLGLVGYAVLDPTLLLSGEQWYKLAAPYHGERYILVYTVAAPTHLYEAAKNMGRRLGVPVKTIKLEPEKSKADMQDIYDVGPADFISLIQNAECVFTTSFHGLAFSLNCEKEVYFEADSLKNKNTTRLTHLAKLLGVMNRQITSDAVSDFCDNPINWEAVREKLQKERERSLEYLLESLQMI